MDAGGLPMTTILIADDHAFVSWSLAKALSVLEGIDIIGSVTNGIEAIVETRKSRPDCALLDFKLTITPRSAPRNAAPASASAHWSDPAAFPRGSFLSPER